MKTVPRSAQVVAQDQLPELGDLPEALSVALADIAGDKYDVLSQLNSFPRIPVNTGAITSGGLIALVSVAAASLLGAILGGLAGMRFHRNVDKAAFQPYGS